MRVGYRLAQFWHNISATPLPEAVRVEITAHLSDREEQLFRRYSHSDQWHVCRVFYALREEGHTHPDLLTAALLHDVGKTRLPLTVWERSLGVLGEALLPGKTAVWGQSSGRGWKRPFAVKQQHPFWGAEMAAAAGSRPLTVSLIRRHQEPLPETAVTEEDRLLRLLQWADDRN